jgi:hypothetical protein
MLFFLAATASVSAGINISIMTSTAIVDAINESCQVSITEQSRDRGESDAHFCNIKGASHSLSEKENISTTL